MTPPRPAAAHNTTRSEWSTLANSIINGIDGEWVNKRLTHSIFITRKSLSNVWKHAPFPTRPDQTHWDLFKNTCHRPNLDFEAFEKNNICLISALIYHRWNPSVGVGSATRCQIRDTGLFVKGSNLQLIDVNLPLNYDQIHAIFGGQNVAFQEGQYRFCPAVLNDDEDEGFFQLEQGIRLPFQICENDKKSRNGWYGEVSKVHVKSGYLVRSAPIPKYVACKKITHSRQNFHDELRSLQLLERNALSHNHIVTHIAAIVVMPSSFNIVFPWAFTDLADFLRNDQRPVPPWIELSNMTSRNLLSEVCYVASALDFLHTKIAPDNQRVAFYHMDLKPDNILVFEPSNTRERRDHPVGLWKITDFGVSDTKTVRMGDFIDFIDPPTSPDQFTDQSTDRLLRRRSGPYQAPEVERRHEFKNQAINHANADVWSYGTVVAEVIAFCEGGHSSVLEMREALAGSGPDRDRHDREAHFYCFASNGRYQLKEKLIDFFQSTHNAYSTVPSKWLREAWIAIKDGAFRINPERRTSATKLRDALKLISDQIPGETIALSPQSIEMGMSAHRQGTSSSTKSIDSSHNLSKSSSSKVSTRPSAQIIHQYPSYTPDMYDNRSPVSRRQRSRNSSFGIPFPAVPQSSLSRSRTDSGSHYSVDTSHDERQSQNFADQSGPSQSQCHSWEDNTEPFAEHLIKHIKPSFLVSNTDGPHAIFSDSKRLCRADITSSCDLKCGGILRDLINGYLTQDDIKISATTMVIRDSSRLLVRPLDGFPLAIDTETLIGAERHVRQFRISADRSLYLEFRDSIEVWNLIDNMQLLQHPKGIGRTDHHESDYTHFDDAAFNAKGNVLFIISREEFQVWRRQEFRHEFNGMFSKVLNDSHDVAPKYSAFKPLLIPTGVEMTCIVQMRDNPDNVFVLGGGHEQRLDLKHETHYISSRLCVIQLPQKIALVCIGHRNGELRFHRPPKHLLLVWELTQDANGRFRPDKGRGISLPKQLNSHANLNTGLYIKPSGPDGTHEVLIMELDGHIMKLKLPLKELAHLGSRLN